MLQTRLSARTKRTRKEALMGGKLTYTRCLYLPDRHTNESEGKGVVKWANVGIDEFAERIHLFGKRERTREREMERNLVGES